MIHLFYPPKILHNHCLQLLLGHEDALREIKNNACANFWGVKEVCYGICASSELWSYNELGLTNHSPFLKVAIVIIMLVVGTY